MISVVFFFLCIIHDEVAKQEGIDCEKIPFYLIAMILVTNN